MDEDSSAKFIGSLTKFLQSLCNGYVEFQKGVELVGHIYLSIDTGEKVDYILHEKVNKNDENSVTFVSNSFHAQPLVEQDKNKTAAKKGAPSQSGVRGSEDPSDDDDIMIVDQTKGTLGSTNSGTVPSRSTKHMFSPSSSHSNQGSSNLTAQGNRQHFRPAASMSSQDSQQDNINIGDVKLEQISSDELLSLASHVGEETSTARASHASSQRGGKVQIRRSSLGDAAGQPVWIKQEAPDDVLGGPDTGWSQNRDGQSDSSNSGSNLYPVMMHQSPAAFSSSSVFPSFPSMSGPSTSAASHHASGQPLPGTSGSGNPYGNPMMGSSHNMSGIDPAVWNQLGQRQVLGDDCQSLSREEYNRLHSKRLSHAEYSRLYYRRLKQDPEKRRLYNMRKARERRRREALKRMSQRDGQGTRQ